MSNYRALWLLRGGHLQTVLGSICFWPRVAYERERWWIENPRDFIDIDWAGPQNASNLLVLFHGLEGDSDGLYARRLGAYFIARGWRFAVPHFRGCSAEPNVQLRSYHAGASDEVALMLQHCAARHGGQVFAVGISLGGNALLRWLGGGGALVKRAAAISAPLDLHVTGAVLGRGKRLFYAWYFLRSLRKRALEKLRRYPGAYLESSVRKARTLRAFDDAVTAPVHGFRDVDDYWTQSSSWRSLKTIEVPTLLLNARNDPFLPNHVLLGIEQLAAAGWLGSGVELGFEEEGGHASFPGGRWLEERVFSFLAA